MLLIQKRRNTIFFIALLFCLYFSKVTIGQNIPANEVLKAEELVKYLKSDVKKHIINTESPLHKELAAYFRNVFAARYFFDWQTFDNRFIAYNSLYNTKDKHATNAQNHMFKFADSTSWKLPFNYLNGDPVNAYALRHLARQHKMVDVAFQYFYSNKDSQYINYFVSQMHSLNYALQSENYETLRSGNGVYEAFRSGYRVLNWLQIHNMFLGEQAYSDKNQLLTIATLLQHGASLYENNQKFRPGNHQTRGLSALAMLAIIFNDFEGTDIWYDHAMKLLGEHLNKEINADGFQFERSVHYHISDISNYFYVYQLAKINGTEIEAEWEAKLRSLFTTLIKIAYPDKTAPVLQDDTDNPWAEFNDISEALTLGYILFEDPEFGYFAENRVDARIYWALQQSQLDLLDSIHKQKPNYASLEFVDTKYYVMRNGWNKNDGVLIISAGVDVSKPDHQHGDVLGIQAFANGNVILPNYQVQYALPDFKLFKNSMVKNVALVDNELQGKLWTLNKGGSGFGKFKQLPKPKTIVWKSNASFDLFVGSHNGFSNIDVDYSRQVINVKNDFWIVKDNFLSTSMHEYKQVWQGHYTYEEGSDLIRSTYSDASGTDILQLNPTNKVASSGKRGKQWNIVSKTDQNDFSFISIVYPYKDYRNRIDESKKVKTIKGWKVNALDNIVSNNLASLSKDNHAYLFDVNEFKIEQVKISFTDKTDVFLQVADTTITVYFLSDKDLEVSVLGSSYLQLNGIKTDSTAPIKPGDKLIILKAASKN